MATYRRTALTALRRLRIPQQRRFASHDSNGHGHSNAHSEHQVKESFGRSFWVVLALPPIIYFLYETSKPNEKNEAPWLTQWLGQLDNWREVNRERNDLHAKLVDQAAEDRILFLHSEEAPVHRKVPVRNLEMINARDPFNRQAGWGSIDLEKLIAHVEKENAKQDQKNLERYKRRLEEEEEASRS